MKNRKYLYPTILGLIVVGVFSCVAGLVIQSASTGIVDNGIVLTDNRAVQDFNKITLKGIGEVTITQGTSESLTVEASEKRLKNLSTKVENGTLLLTENDNKWHISFQLSWTPIKYNIVVKDLTAITLEGTGSMIVNKLNTDKIVITQKGTGEIYIKDLTANSITTSMQGTGSVTVRGEVQDQTLTSEGVGAYEAKYLKSQNTTVDMKGVGGVEVWVTTLLKAKLEGVGSLEYYGSPRVEESTKGLGQVDKMGETP
jgi:hypothetical protein